MPQIDHRLSGAQGENCQVTHDMNLALIDCLAELETKNEIHKRKQMFWRNNGIALTVLPSVTALSLSYSPLAERFDGRELVAANAYALMGSFVLGVVALYRHDKHKDNGYKAAQAAAPISHAINKTLQPWITQRFEERNPSQNT